MRIALIAPLNFPINDRFIGGLECFIYKFSRRLILLGHKVALYASGDSSVPGVKIVPVCKTGLQLKDDGSRQFVRESIKAEMAHNFKLMCKLLLENTRFDIYHINSYNFLLLAMQNDKFAKKSITTLHVPIESNFIKNCHQALGEKIRKINFVTISDFQTRRAEGLNVVTRIYNGIDTQEFTYQKKGAGYIGWLGRISQEKGLDVAIKMAKKYNWNFKFAGSIHSKQYFEEKIEPFIGGNIQYLGEKFGKEKDEFYGGCDVFLSPIQWDEPFGLTIIEAMACGSPVVAFKRGAMPEIINNGKTGYVVKDGDLNGFSQSVEKARSIARNNCRLEVEKLFTLERMSDEYIDLYKKIIKNAYS